MAAVVIDYAPRRRAEESQYPVRAFPAARLIDELVFYARDFLEGSRDASRLLKSSLYEMVIGRRDVRSEQGKRESE